MLVAVLVPLVPLLHGLSFLAGAAGLLQRREGARKAQVALGALLFPLSAVWSSLDGAWMRIRTIAQYALGGFLSAAGASLTVTRWVRDGPRGAVA